MKLLAATISTAIGFSLLCHSVYAQETQPMATIQPAQTTTVSPGQAYLDANKVKPGVITLADGLQYKVITQGAGPMPTDNDTVVVHYSGSLIDGTEFDSSYKRGEPISFPVNGVIPGWVEALKMMKVGSTWELTIPPDLAYGQRGAPPLIGPNQVLVFKVNLIDIKK